MNWKKLTLVLVLSLSLLNGCVLSPIKPNLPVKYQWGKKGEQPTAVWTDYDWTIVASED